jgi:hypothetical protein
MAPEPTLPDPAGFVEGVIAWAERGPWPQDAIGPSTCRRPTSGASGSIRRVLTLVASELSLQRIYFPIVKGTSQLRIPKNLDDEKSFAGVLGASIALFREKGYQCSLSIANIPRPKGADRAMTKSESKLNRLLTITASKK